MKIVLLFFLLITPKALFGMDGFIERNLSKQAIDKLKTYVDGAYKDSIELTLDPENSVVKAFRSLHTMLDKQQDLDLADQGITKGVWNASFLAIEYQDLYTKIMKRAGSILEKK